MNKCLWINVCFDIQYTESTYISQITFYSCWSEQQEADFPLDVYSPATLWLQINHFLLCLCQVLEDPGLWLRMRTPKCCSLSIVSGNLGVLITLASTHKFDLAGGFKKLNIFRVQLILNCYSTHVYSVNHVTFTYLIYHTCAHAVPL